MNMLRFAKVSARVLLLAAGLISLRAEDADATLNSFFQQYLEAHFRLQPLEATRLGDHRFDHLLDDLSAPARAGWTRHLRQTLADLPKQVDYRALSRDAQIDYEIFRDELAKSLWLSENTRPFEEDPRVYLEYINDPVYLLLTQSSLPKEANVANCLARMALIPRVVAAARTNLKNPPRPHTETAIRQNRGAIAFYEKDLFHLAGKTRYHDALKSAAQPVLASLREYQALLENDLLPRATGDWRLGPEKFRRKLELELDAGVTADGLLANAEAEFTRVQDDMYVIARQLWGVYFAGQPLPPDDAVGRRATVRKVLERIARDHSRPAELTGDVRQAVVQVRKFLAAGEVVKLPVPDHCQIIEMPEFQRGNATAYMNSPPPLDPNASGFFAVSPPPRDWDARRVASYLEEYNRQMLQILAIHEAYPGHYVQFEYANRNHSLIRKVFSSGVYVEGWAVYTEQTMLDQGYGQGDLALRLTQLKFYLRAVVNAILDHRMHCTALTDDDALHLLVDSAYQSEGEARLKIIRAQQSSVQLSTYFAGRMAHYRLRQQIEREQGDQFNLARYHEAVLAPGPVPVKFLPELVRASLKAPKTAAPAGAAN